MAKKKTPAKKAAKKTKVAKKASKPVKKVVAKSAAVKAKGNNNKKKLPAKKVAASKVAASPKKPGAKKEKVVAKKTAAPAAPAKTGKKGRGALPEALAVSANGGTEPSSTKSAKKSAPALNEDALDNDEDLAEAEEEVILTDAEGRRYCRVQDCDQLAQVEAYCRYHYLLFWKKIQIRKRILSEGKLERYVEELTARYPDKYLEMLRKDLRTEKEFLAAIQELEIDEGSEEGEFEDEAQNYIEEMRGGVGNEAAREDDDF